MTLFANALDNDAATDAAWLQAHAPTDCYADGHAAAGKALVAIRTAAAAIIEAAKTGDGKAIDEQLVTIGQAAVDLEAAAKSASDC